MTEADDSITFREQLNKGLESASASGHYAAINSLIIYWNESDGENGYKEEGHQLGAFLEERLSVRGIEYFPIPESFSERNLRSAVLNAIGNVEKEAELNGGSGLLIVHYGGHGDPADDKHDGETRRATWRAFRKGGPSVQWFKIQEEFEDTASDILLLLDCCHSAQAGRGRAKDLGRIELLAAAGSREETPQPGPRSFTKILINVMGKLIEEQGCVIISELYRRLIHRDEKLYTVPFHAKLRFGPSEKSIRLLPPEFPRKAIQPEDWATAVRVIVRMTEQLDDVRIKELVSWLRTDAPDTVSSVQAEEVLVKTSYIGKFLQSDLSDRTKPLVRTLEKPDLDSIRSAWAYIQNLIHQYTRQRQAPLVAFTKGRLAKGWTTRFLEEMEKGNLKIIETLEQSVLMSNDYSQPGLIQEVIDDPSTEILGIRDKLQLRRIVCYGLGSNENMDILRTPAGLQGKRLLEEYKTYGEDQSEGEILDIKDRVALLAQVLQSEKSVEFRALRLCYWGHRKFEHRFIYQFEIPAKYGGESRTLYDAIKQLRNRNRPSLGERFEMARCIANAVQHWHSVGWVHQGISSHNIIFFANAENNLEYSFPYLHGFDFSRPNARPSLSRYVDDINFNIYRHPDRQGPSRSGHRKSHDLYSLGVVLLEIGLWRRAIDIIIDTHGRKKFTKEEMQVIFNDAAKNHLAHHVGKNYQLAVSACLMCDFGENYDGEENSRMAKAVDEKVVDKLGGGEDIE